MIRGVILDLDGTVYLGHAEVPGAADCVAFLRRHGIRPLFVTNRANRLPGEVCAHLRGYGIACEEHDVLTSSEATARALKPGRAFWIGEAGLSEPLTAAGFVFDDERPDYVIVSFDRTFTYDKLKRACRLIDAGARFVATNPDRALKTDHGLTPGTGALVAAVAAGCGQSPLVVGKPERLIMDMAVARLALPRDTIVAVGDNLATDIPAAARAELRGALILTGVSRREDVPAAPVQPDWIVADFAELTARIRAENGLDA